MILKHQVTFVTRKVEKKINFASKRKKDAAKYQEDTKSNQNNIFLATSKNAYVSFITLSIHLFDL